MPQQDQTPKDDDDFGDFDEAPSVPQAQQQCATSTHPDPASFTADPEMQDAKAIFAHMQTKYSFQDIDPSDDSCNDLKGCSLDEFMVSVIVVMIKKLSKSKCSSLLFGQGCL